jgi:hypothetical protein
VSNPTTTVSKQNIAADTAAAQAAALRLSGFPAGWTAESSSSNADAELEKLKADLANCLGVEASTFAKAPASYDSPDFANSEDQKASSTDDYTATAAEQETAFVATYTNPKFTDCAGAAFTGSARLRGQTPCGDCGHHSGRRHLWQVNRLTHVVPSVRRQKRRLPNLGPGYLRGLELNPNIR